MKRWRRLLELLMVVCASAASAERIHPQSPARHSWFTTVGEVRAADDGWVELLFSAPVPLSPHYSSYDDNSAGTALFSPALVRRWATAARRAVDDTAHRGRVDVPELTNGTASISFAVVRDSMRTQYEMFTNACRSGMNVGPTRAEVLLLTDALSSAARVATQSRTVPKNRGQGPFSRPLVTCPARFERGAMPAWSATLGRRPAARGEAIARFVVTEDGRVDLATLSWDRPLGASVAQIARAALARWRYEAAESEGRQVRQWTHAPIWFADSADADERLLAGWTRTTSFVARRDGRISHSPLSTARDSLWHLDEPRLFREAYPPSVVRAWLSGMAARDPHGPSLTVVGGVTRKDNDSGGAFYQGCAADGILSTQGITVAGRSAQLDSIRLVLAQAERIELRAVDSTRVHGETEVTCPARLRDALPPTLTGLPGVREAVLSFVVTRDGRVDPASVITLGSAAAPSLATARGALLALRWVPGRLSGVAVPQRAHLVLYPLGRRPMELATEACAQAYTAAVRLHVHEPSGGIAGPELTRAAHAMSRRVGLQGRPPATSGRFLVTLDDSGAGHYFSWVRPPADSAGGEIVRYTLGGQIEWSTYVAPLALEGELARACP